MTGLEGAADAGAASGAGERGLGSRLREGSRDLLTGFGALFSGDRIEAKIPSLLLAETRGLGTAIFRSLLVVLVALGVGVFFYRLCQTAVRACCGPV